LIWLFAATLAGAELPRIEIRDNELWLTDGGPPRQLTHDGRSKLQAEFSPSRGRIAYYEQCPQSEGCLTSVIILDPTGKRLQTFHVNLNVLGQSEPCASILEISWVSEDVMSAVCHMNPSVSDYLEIDPRTEQTLREYFGYGFTRSPDSKHIAHVGPLIHFAPPYAKSNYLLIDDVTVYPMPKGVRPYAGPAFETPHDVVRTVGNRYIGIHDFVPRFYWSPDSKKVAFIDCVSDWIETGSETGIRSGPAPKADAPSPWSR
jgi:hypothetical protein